MKRFTLTAIFMITSILLFSQNDFIILEKKHVNDTIKCKILKNSIDSVVYVSNDTLYKILCDKSPVFTGLQVPDKLIIYGLRLKLVRFCQNPKTSNTISDLFSKDMHSPSTPPVKLYWFGIDFSKVNVKLGIAPRTQYSNNFFLDCNDFILSEKGISVFRKSFNLILDTGIIAKRNSKIDLSSIYNNKGKPFTPDSIRETLKQFTSSNDGIGVVIFITSINKPLELETIHVVFFDIKTRSLLLCLDDVGNASGIGMAHHWTDFIRTYLDSFATKKTWRKRFY